MSAYDNDPRVKLKGSGNLDDLDVLTGNSYDVDLDGVAGSVWRRRPNLWVAAGGTSPYGHFDTADEAIRSLIGDPR